MLIQMLKSKIHRATVTEADLNYEGSITIDKTLMDAAKMYHYEKVEVLNLNSGARAETYIIEGEPDSGTICCNGALARLVQPGDLVIILAYCIVDESEVSKVNPIVVRVDNLNKILLSSTRSSKNKLF